MIGDVSERVAQVLRMAQREALLSETPHPLLDREQIESRVPHRGCALLLDAVTAWDRPQKLLRAYSDLSRAAAVFEGHFPGSPVYPGVLQIEAIGQAGVLLRQLEEGGSAGPVALTHVKTAKFLHPVLPGAPLDIVSYVEDDGLFFTVAGQCLQDSRVCSVAVVSGLIVDSVDSMI